eukprot:jgi/Psemu1/323059/estExt_fgenesh1_pg.C_550014
MVEAGPSSSSPGDDSEWNRMRCPVSATDDGDNGGVGDAEDDDSDDVDGDDEDDEEDDEDDDEQVLRMECASAASPRWLSFPKSSPLTRVASFFTNTSLASLAPSEEDEEKEQQTDANASNANASSRNKYKQHASNNNNNNNNDDTRQQLFKIGVVRGGRLETTQDDNHNHNHINNNNNDGESSLYDGTTTTGSAVPWEELVLDLYENLTVDGGRSTQFGGTHTECLTESTSTSASRSAIPETTPNDDEILRDLQELERERSLGDAVVTLVRTTNAACDLKDDPHSEDPDSFGSVLHRLVNLWNEGKNVATNDEDDFDDGFDDDGDGDADADADRGSLRRSGNTADDLQSVADAASDAHDWIAEYEWVVLALLVCNALLATVVSILLIDATLWQRRRRTMGRGPPVVVLSLFVTLAMISFCCSVAFGMGSTIGADLCSGGNGNGSPDRAVLGWLAAQKERLFAFSEEEEQQPWEASRDRFYDLAMHAIRHCPQHPGDVVVFVADTTQQQQQNQQHSDRNRNWNWNSDRNHSKQLDKEWVFFQAAWDAGTLAAEAINVNSVDPNHRASTIRDVCVLGPDSSTALAAAGGQLADASCEASAQLRELVDVVRCDKWYPLYREGMHDAVCSSGVSGFVWVTVTQAFVVILSLLMLTVREGYFDDRNRSRHVNGSSESATALNTTAITDDTGRSTALCSEPRAMIGDEMNGCNDSKNKNDNGVDPWFDWEADHGFGRRATGTGTTETSVETGATTSGSHSTRTAPHSSRSKQRFSNSYRNVDHTGMIHSGGAHNNKAGVVTEFETYYLSQPDECPDSWDY